MTETEILEIVSGNTTIGTFSDRPLSYAVYVEPNGRLIGRISDGNSEKIELGSWRVDNNMLCGRWDNLKDGEENCFTYHRIGSNVHAYNSDGSLDRIQFFVDGDPYNLQQAALISTQNASSNCTEIEREIRKFIAGWGEAWSPKENAAQFTRTSFAPFYLQSDELLAFDFTDAESRTVFKGVQIHHDTWEAFVRDYNYWTFTPVVESIRVYPQSDSAAAVTLYVDTHGKKPDETEFKARAHATLLLEKQNSNWIIVHENIWGPVNE
jgi:ketosteroid isomerase-like protein